MNIIDMLKDSSSEDKLSNEIAVKSEARRIKRRFDDFIDGVLDYINSERAFINKNLSYALTSQNITLSQEQKEMLFKELERNAKEISTRIGKEVNDIYSSSEKTPNNNTTVSTTEVSVVKPVEVNATPKTDYFGY